VKNYSTSQKSRQGYTRRSSRHGMARRLRENPGPAPGGIRPLRPHSGARVHRGLRDARRGQFWHRRPRDPEAGSVDDGVEPGHTPRPRGRSKCAHAVEFSKTVAPLQEGASFSSARTRSGGSRSGPVSIAPKSRGAKGITKQQQTGACAAFERRRPRGPFERRRPRGPFERRRPRGPFERRRPRGPFARRRPRGPFARRRPLGQHLHADGPAARAVVEVDQDDLLPGAQDQLTADDRDRLRWPDQRGA
jgi:hypothetical protein